MNYTQNQKIEQVTESTLVLGVDIGSSEHYVRAFDYRGRELTRKVFRFSTDINGFNSFYDWVTQICIKHGKNEAMIGCEPTGHYWYTFYQFVKDHGMKLAFVNPASVKKAKELDDNSPKKTDLKDPKTIAKLVIDGRYSFPYVPEGIYAEIREVTSSRDRIMKELNAASNRIQRWLKIYFPEYLTVYKKFDTTTGIEMGEDGQIKCDSEEVQEWISPEDKVSMNMWAGYPEFLDFLAEDFKDFLVNVEEGDLKSEYLLPNIVDKLLKEEKANVKVLETQDRWFGVTYKEDKETVQDAFREFIADGVYAEILWE